jgi:Domain of unknown function (DUF6456)
MARTGQGICEQDAVDEGRRILRKLAEEGGHLAPTEEGDFALMSCVLPGSVRIAAAMVREFRRRDWLAPRPGAPETFVLSDAGLGWVRRQLAPQDPFAAQHQLRGERVIKDEGGAERPVVVNDGESPLGWLHRRGIIDTAELEAGERLRRDFTYAQLSPRMGIDLAMPVVDNTCVHDAALADTVLAAKQRFTRAMRAAGPVLSDLLFDVCCHLIGLEAAESARDWPRRTAKVVLQIGLARLAGHYGLNVRRNRAVMRSWRMECGEEAQPSA